MSVTITVSWKDLHRNKISENSKIGCQAHRKRRPRAPRHAMGHAMGHDKRALEHSDERREDKIWPKSIESLSVSLSLIFNLCPPRAIMNPYNPAKYVLRAPPPVPPRPGTGPESGNEIPAPALPPRPPSMAPLAFPPPPPRPAQQQIPPSPPRQEYNPATYHDTAGQALPPPAPFPQQQSVPPSPSRNQAPSYHVPATPATAPTRNPLTASYGVSTDGRAHSGDQQPLQFTPYQLPATATYPPPPDPQARSHAPPPAGAFSARPVPTQHTQPPPLYYPPAPEYPLPPNAQVKNYGAPSIGTDHAPHVTDESTHLQSNSPLSIQETSQPSKTRVQGQDAPRVGERYRNEVPQQPSPQPPLSPTAGPEPAKVYHGRLNEQQPQPPSSSYPTQGLPSSIESLTESMSHTHIGQGANPPTVHTQMRPKTPPRPHIQYDPPAKFTLRGCPSTMYILMGESQWYCHPQVPDLRVCTYCYEKHIQPAGFKRHFEHVTVPAGSKPQCLFSCPRIEEDIWPRIIQLGSSLRELLQFFAHRLPLRNCPRQRGVLASENIKWYQPKDNRRFPDFVACQACYEDVLLAGPLRNEFMPSPDPQPKEAVFVCDVHNPFIRRLATKTNSMDTFITESAQHLHLPECQNNGQMVGGHSKKWYQLRNSSSITVCQRCYREFAVRTEFEHQFYPVSRPSTQHRCMLGMWQTRSVWGEALARHDFRLWERTALEAARTPPCTLEIPTGAPVYQIHGVENFDVCHGCYIGCMKPHGLDRFFHQLPTRFNRGRVCDLNSSAPRFTSFAHKLDEAMITATFATFTTFAARLCPLDMCPKLNLTTGRQWYGTETCRICPACYEEVVRDSFLSAYLPPTPVTLPGETDCDLYSPRMRSKFDHACATQNPAFFFDFAVYRKGIYNQTVPEMRQLVAMAEHNLSMQQMYNTASTAYNNMDGISSVGMYYPRWRYTGAGVAGTFWTHWGVEGAQMGQTALGYMRNIQGDTARVKYLQGIWDAVE
ncbi:uncharacterized protein BJX67DRAFT_366947 [Aspergillus lucknowensis]|uniref:Integral membrane protein n=1 Tax=Aspergillus lucknowensis TaxID=176173 RepID=A0ABR4LCX2_9EURO